MRLVSVSADSELGIDIRVFAWGSGVNSGLIHTWLAGFLGLGDLATRFRDGLLIPSVWHRRDVMAGARASSRVAAPERRTNSSRNCFLNASLLPDRLNSSKSLQISMAASSEDCSLVTQRFPFG